MASFGESLDKGPKAATMSKKSSGKTEIEIFGAVYPVRGGEDSGYLQELASTVDRKMRDVAQQVTTVDTARIAILAALNLSDELFQCRRGLEGERVQLRERVARLDAELASALDA